MDFALSAGGNQLKPEIEHGGEYAQGKPLEGVAMVLLHPSLDTGPLAREAVTGVAALQHRSIKQIQLEFLCQRSQLDILPDRTRGRRAQLV